MCGIHGLVALDEQTQFTQEQLIKMGDATIHRGPDDSGEYVGEGVAIGMRRLSIIDLAGGHQPISNSDDSIWLVCNGEIYNFQSLRETLTAKGYVFKTGSDVEVIIHLYQEYGDNCLQHLNGMFAFALWDQNKKRLLIARDRLGIKPLYYAQFNNSLAFSTEAKAILALDEITPSINKVALSQYLELGYVPAPLCLFDGIRKLEVASYLVIENGNISQHSYWQPEFESIQQSDEQWATDIYTQLEKSVKDQMVSDVPIGAFLSGGIDSSAIVALMAKHSDKPVKTYAIGFDTGKAGELYNELPYAKQVSELFGTEHKEIVVRPDVVSLLPKLLWHMDEPIADSAFITTYLVSKFARQDSTVIISGVGGDEIFAGYRRYQGEKYAAMYHKIPKLIRKNIIAPLAKYLPADRGNKWLNYSRLAKSFIESAELPFAKRYHSYMEVFSAEFRDRLLTDNENNNHDIKALFTKKTTQQAIWQMFDIDRQSQLPDDLLMLTDKMTMATSLECRVPFLDHEMVELAAKIPQDRLMAKGELKHLLKLSLKDTLPDSILFRKKRGFGAPMGAWLKDELSGLMNSLLNKESVDKRGLFHWSVIEKTISAHSASKEDHTDHLSALMNLEIWCQLYLDGRSSEEITQSIKDAI
jgi:asparagine synthase (glutamine-hydrolysing)